MTLESLRIFVDVPECEYVIKAAEALSQPSIEAVKPSAVYDVATLPESAANAERGISQLIAGALADESDGPPDERFNRRTMDVDRQGPRFAVASVTVNRDDRPTWLDVITGRRVAGSFSLADTLDAKAPGNISASRAAHVSVKLATDRWRIGQALAVLLQRLSASHWRTRH